MELTESYPVPPDQARNLISRLHHVIDADQQHLCVLLGAGATAPIVPGVAEMTVSALSYAERHSSPSNASVAETDRGSTPERPVGIQGQKIHDYSEALQWVQQVRGADGVRAVVQEAVLQARIVPQDWTADSGPLLDDVFRGWERQSDSWRLPEGLMSLATIIQHHNQSISRYLFTTNFDPLIEIALRRSGIEARTISIESDAVPGDHRPGVETEKTVVHLHGDCYGRTLHAPWALRRSRSDLEGWISSILDDQLLLVVGYSGWDDIISRVLEQKLKANPAFEVLWAVYEDQEQHRHINPSLEEFFARNSSVVTAYYGVDRDPLFTDLLIDLGLHLEPSAAGFGRSGNTSPVYEFARATLNRSYRFGMSHLEPDAKPNLVFWPHRLRKPHLIHGVHALSAMLLTKLGIPVELHLDDSYIPSERAERLAHEFSDAVEAWFGVCGVMPLPTVIRTSHLLGSAEAIGEPATTRLWRLAEEFFAESTTVFDILLATKTVDASEQNISAPTGKAHHLLRPLFTWLALEHSVRRHEDETGEQCHVLTLGGADEQKMWDLWHARQGAAPLANLYVPRLERPPAGKNLWDYTELRREAAYSGLDLERFTRQMTQAGNDGEAVLEWIYEAAVRLASAVASHRGIGEMRYGDTAIESWGEALDALRREPIEAQRALANAVSQWFHA